MGEERYDEPGAGGVADPPYGPRPGDPLAPDPSAPPNDRPERVVVPRWIQLVVLPLSLLALYGVVRAAGGVALLFLVAALIALLLNPLVSRVQRRGLSRGVSVGVVMISLAVVLAGAGLLLAAPVSTQVSNFSDSVPGIVDDANAELADVQRWLDKEGVDVEIQRPGETAVKTLASHISSGSGELVSFTRHLLTLAVEGALAVILIVVLSVYMLLYGQRIGAGVRSIMPRGDGSPDDDYPTRVQRALLGYVRGQLLFSLIMGGSAGVSLWILGSLGVFPDGKTYAFVFGAWYGFAELIPYVGPAIGGLPPVVVAALSDTPLDAVWLIVLFTLLQQIEGHIVAPTLFSQALRINPLLVIFALLIGGRLYGFAGAFLALPTAAVLRESLVYLRRHLVLEPWNTPTIEDLTARGKPPPPPSQPPVAGGAACSDCGTVAPPGAAYCAACGSELADPDAAAAAASGAPS
jgi:predicted PurR-regulated permease PerM